MESYSGLENREAESCRPPTGQRHRPKSDGRSAAPLRRTDFLDVELDLSSMSFAPLQKPNSRTLYVNAKSNHPKYICVLTSVPKSVSDRLIKRSSDKKHFDECEDDCERALKDAGCTTKLSCHLN